MENEKRKYWFFGSKLNTVLLLVLIILMVIALKWMFQNKETYLPTMTPNPNGPGETLQLGEDKSSTTLDLSDPYTRGLKTTFTAALQKPADFNGHYVVARYGCGSGCMAFGVVDKNTGKAYQGPTDDYGGDYDVPSNFEATRYSLNSNLFKVVGYTGIKNYQFNGAQFVLAP